MQDLPASQLPGGQSGQFGGLIFPTRTEGAASVGPFVHANYTTQVYGLCNATVHHLVLIYGVVFSCGIVGF
jgi:hypothetical protein